MKKSGLTVLVLLVSSLTFAETDYRTRATIENWRWGKDNTDQIQELRVKGSANVGGDLSVGGQLIVSNGSLVLNPTNLNLGLSDILAVNANADLLSITNLAELTMAPRPGDNECVIGLSDHATAGLYLFGGIPAKTPAAGYVRLGSPTNDGGSVSLIPNPATGKVYFGSPAFATADAATGDWDFYDNDLRMKALFLNPTNGAINFYGSSTNYGQISMTANKSFYVRFADSYPIQVAAGQMQLGDGTDFVYVPVDLSAASNISLSGSVVLDPDLPGASEILWYDGVNPWSTARVRGQPSLDGSGNSVLSMGLNNGTSVTSAVSSTVLYASLSPAGGYYAMYGGSDTNNYHFFNGTLGVNGALAVGGGAQFFTNAVRGVKSIEITELIDLTPVSETSVTNTGTIYYDSDDNKLKFWNGTAWETITSAP